MTTSTDERRARVAWLHMFPEHAETVNAWENFDDEWLKDRYRDLARAIRASDDAAGMVLVKRNAEDPDEPMSWDEWLKAQATETNNG